MTGIWPRGERQGILSALENIHVHQAPVVQTLDSAIHRINHYPLDSVID